MPSGQFQSIAINSIIINRAERQRRELPNLDVLADSIKRLGLIHPIVITSDLELVAGERRLEAIRSLGWTHINVQYLDDLDALSRHAIELEENIKREALPWQDECKAIADYHALRASQIDSGETWTQEDTAEALGMSRTAALEKIKVADELRAGNKMVAEAPKLSVARGLVRRAEARKTDSAMAALSALTGPAPSTSPEPSASPILTADFNEWAPTYTGPKFNFVHCDFPYGINADKFNQGSASAHGGYADSEDVYWQLCATLAAHLERITEPSCHFMFWFSMKFYNETLAFFREHTDIWFDPFPLVWVKSDNVGVLPDPERGPRRVYETAFYGSRGDRKIVRAASNSFHGPSERDEHMSIKPSPMLAHFFKMFVDGSTVFLDPTCGSGGSVRAAKEGGARIVRGLEVNPEFAERARRKNG